MTNAAGFWQSTVIPKLEEKVSRASWKTVLSSPAPKSKAGGESHPDALVGELISTLGDKKTNLTERPAQKYPAGRPLRDEEVKAGRNRKPKSLGGRYLRWDYSTHAGCNFDATNCPRGKH